MRLGSGTSDHVMICVVSCDTTESTVSVDNITFTSSNWNADSTVTITGLADNLSDGDQSYSTRLRWRPMPSLAHPCPELRGPGNPRLVSPPRPSASFRSQGPRRTPKLLKTD